MVLSKVSSAMINFTYQNEMRVLFAQPLAFNARRLGRQAALFFSFRVLAQHSMPKHSRQQVG
jgi:hypothetical protein